MSAQLLDMLLLLLLLPLHPLRLSCCSHHQECATPPATRAPPLLQRENKQQRGVLPLQLTIRLRQMQLRLLMLSRRICPHRCCT